MVAFILVGVCLFAKVTLRGQTDRSSRVAMFDGYRRLSAKSEAPGSTRGYDGRRRDSADFGGRGFCGGRRWVGYLINTTIVTAAQ
jgi:hypothetical protein